MSNEEKDILAFLNKVRELNPNMKFKCGFGACDDTYIVEVEAPEGSMDEEPYSRMEFDFTNTFEAEHPYYFILFVPKGDMVGIESVLFSVGYENVYDTSYSSLMPSFDFSCNEWQSSIDNYAIAA